MSTRSTISVVVPTFNVALLLTRCLESILWVDEIIIVDMGSTDGTIEISKKYKAKIIHNLPPDGNFDKNRELGMRRARTDWILKLDSDEELTAALQDEIKNFLKNDDKFFNGFFLRNKIFMFGKQVKHGFIKDNSKELRMYRKGKWTYNPYKYHEQVFVSGETGELKNYYNHYNIRSISEFLLKTNKYTDLDSKNLVDKYYKSPFLIALSFPWTLVKYFVIQKGFLDGELGVKTCFLYSLYYLIEKIKIWEVRKLNDENSIS